MAETEEGKALPPDDKRYHLTVLAADTIDCIERITKELGNDAAKEAYSEAFKATCSASCNGCCYQLFEITFPEGAALARWLLDHGYEANALADQLIEAFQKGIGKTSRDYFLEKNPCVFLIDGRCSVYEGRPLTCRLHFVQTDPKLCHPDSGAKGIEVRYLDRKFWIDFRNKAWIIAEEDLGLAPEIRGLTGSLPAMTYAGLVYLRAGVDAVQMLLKRKGP